MHPVQSTYDGESMLCVEDWSEPVGAAACKLIKGDLFALAPDEDGSATFSISCSNQHRPVPHGC